ncbi:MAG: RtcB family protein [Nitrospiria bacterium]
MPVKKTINKGVPVKIWTDEIDPKAIGQLENISRLPFIHRHVAAMPDVHWGIGATIGAVIPSKGAIIPAAVGVDLGCGVMACRLDLEASDLPDNLYVLRREIESAVPHGRSHGGGRNDRGAWKEIPRDVAEAYAPIQIEERLAHLLHKHPKLLGGHVNKERHLGTLGTGNHFIEVCLDEAHRVWVMLHSGSRGIGNRIGTYFIDLAKKDMDRQVYRSRLPDADLAYLQEGSKYFNDYVDAVHWAQSFASINREIMTRRTLDAISSVLKRPVSIIASAINCHHNYVAKEKHFGEMVWITRKGAIRARLGDMGIIPGSMGTNSFIVRGKGCREAFCSCAHGAGRKLGRRQARKRFSAHDLEEQTKGIECPKDVTRVDEIPAAYKSIETVMNNQSDLVEIVHTLNQVVNVKG